MLGSGHVSGGGLLFRSISPRGSTTKNNNNGNNNNGGNSGGNYGFGNIVHYETSRTAQVVQERDEDSSKSSSGADEDTQNILQQQVEDQIQGFEHGDDNDQDESKSNNSNKSK